MVLDVIGLVDVVESRLADFRIRLDRFRQHPQQYAMLVAAHDRICEKLRYLHASLSETSNEETKRDMRLFQAHINSADSDLSSLSEYLSIPSNGLDSQSSGGSRRLKRIANAFSKASAKTRAIQRTTRNEETLSSVQNHLNNAWRVLNEIRLVRIEEGIKAITLGEREEFKGRVVVQPNPENLVLDFESMDENGAAVTCEGKLKQAIMQPGSSFVSVIDGIVTGAIGGGGMGKSCAVRGLTALQEVRDMFPGGIYEISLGLDAGELTLKKELCNCIEMSGGVILAKQTMSERNMNEVIRKAEG
ncbi:hypothetical protein BWQ96_04493 [Gracilariopsis chorda]|uniref:Uncharacterized protein n=1 Tax=Gracilariopsis chorda TaxID=448386 RepID=A0A2V3IUE3_9FLOR|nr:hypothetical protein BWQ96_04493 [Gracilariopsis chorda]|eukprot:PXF45725.1 hypothetical protein BWQ96_04493 [Gracilariopsis chorda]